MTKPEHKQMMKNICEYMGEDINSLACKEVEEHLQQCPTCRVYFDTVKKTVTLCQEMEEEKKLPDDVKSRLFKVLDLEQIKAARAQLGLVLEHLVIVAFEPIVPPASLLRISGHKAQRVRRQAPFRIDANRERTGIDARQV